MVAVPRFFPLFLICSAAAFAAPDPTFYKDVLPILQNRCQECHRPGEIGPMPLSPISRRGPGPRPSRKRSCCAKMPPWFADPHYGKFANDRSLTKNEIDTLAAWADGRAKRAIRRTRPRRGVRRRLEHRQARPGARDGPAAFAIPAKADDRLSVHRAAHRVSPKTNGCRWRRRGPATARWCITWSSSSATRIEWLRGEAEPGIPFVPPQERQAQATSAARATKS